jgi:hypothetical protein
MPVSRASHHTRKRPLAPLIIHDVRFLAFAGSTRKARAKRATVEVVDLKDAEERDRLLLSSGKDQ